MAVAGDAGVDEGWVEFAEGGVVEAVFGESGGEVVLDEDVGCCGEAVEDFLAGGVFEG